MYGAVLLSVRLVLSIVTNGSGLCLWLLGGGPRGWL